MKWEVEYTDEFENWWNNLTENEQESVDASVRLLEEYGANLLFPHLSEIKGSRYSHMRELRIQHAGKPFRILYAFDPRRCAILLIGGVKTGKNRWYEKYIPLADSIYEQHLEELCKEVLKNGT